MADRYPRVASLRYSILWDEPFDYVRGAELEGYLRGFHFRLRDRSALFTPTTHVSTPKEALALLEPQLRAWEMDAAIRHGPGALQFHYLRTRVQHMAQGPSEAVGDIAVGFRAKAKGSSVLSRHPEPPAEFVVDEYVEALADMLLLSRATPLTLLYVAYGMFTLIQQQYGDVGKASKALGVAANVLKSVKTLSNSRGKGAAARKHDRKPTQPKPELSAAELKWLTHVLSLIVRHAGAAAAGVQFTDQVTLADLPPLS